MKCSSSGSGSGSGSGEEERCDFGVGVRSRSGTIWKAGSVARIAGVIMSGSSGRFLSIDFRISLDVEGTWEGKLLSWVSPREC